jgi:hypothetical protein
MTQTQIEQTRVIAERDGWELRGEPDFIHPYKIWIKQMQMGTKMIPYISPSGKEYHEWHKDMKYLTSLDWLHPVAMEVMDKLTELFNDTMDGDVFMPVSDLEYNIKRSCYIRPINGEYIDLFNAVYEGIVYLKKQG